MYNIPTDITHENQLKYPSSNPSKIDENHFLKKKGESTTQN